MAENFIRIVIDYVTKGAKEATAQVRKANEGLFKQKMESQKLTSTQKLASKQIESFRIQQSGFAEVMGMSQEKFREFNEQGYKFSKVGGRLANRFRMLTHGTRGFKMELLSVMFFGMAIQRAFSRLLRPVMETYGVFELFSNVLKIVYLPIMEKIYPIILKVALYFMNLNKSIKLVIGVITILGFVLGTSLFLIGMVGLGIGGLIMTFGAWSIVIKRGIGGLLRLLPTLLMTTGAMTGMVPVTLAAAGGINLVSAASNKAIPSLGGVTTAAGSATTAFSGLAIAAKSAAATISIIAWPLLILVAAIATIIIHIKLWQYLIKKQDSILQWFTKRYRMIVTSLVLFSEWLKDRTLGSWEEMGKGLESVIEWLSGLWETLKENSKTGLDLIKEKVTEAWETIKTNSKNGAETTKAKITEAWNILKSDITLIWNGIESTLLGIWDSLTETAKNTFSTAKLVLSGIWDDMWSDAKSTWNSIKTSVLDIITSLTEEIQTSFDESLPNFKQWGIDLVNNIIDGIKSIGSKIIDTIFNLFPAWARDSIRRVGTAAISTIKPTTEKISRIFTGEGSKPLEDFLIRPGMNPISFSPADTIIGTKTPGAIGKGQTTIYINPTYSVNVSDRYEFERLLKDNNTKMVEDVRRLIQD